MKKAFYKIERILDLYFFPFLVNGYKEEEYYRNLRKKYNIPDESPVNSKS